METDINWSRRAAAVRCTSAAGHEYGGQTVALLGQLLYSGSKDCSVRSVDITVNC